MNTDFLLNQIKSGAKLSLKDQIVLIVKLSIPAIFAQISAILMEYIDAAMVGRLGEKSSAAIGLVATSTWLLYGLMHAVSAGFTVQVAFHIGANDEKSARRIVRTGLMYGFVLSLILMSISALVSHFLPMWLGGEKAIWHESSMYFLIFALAIPFYQINNIAGGMLQCSGNMKLPSILHIIMCILDVIFNFFLIFPSRYIYIFGLKIFVPGANLGVIGAALGTSISVVIISLIMLFNLLFKDKYLKLRKEEHLEIIKSDIVKAFKIGIPVGVEEFIMCAAYIASTVIIAPLGTVAIAAHSFAITAESLCYMPGYGIGSAATTVTGQSIGAKRMKLAGKLGWISVILGISMMGLSGALMYVIAPLMMGLLTPVATIRALGVKVLRIELFAEPLYGASIVSNGVFRGAGDTKWPCIINFLSVWLVRIPLSAILATKIGLEGVWLAMCIELCVRGIFYLIKFATSKRFKTEIVE